MFLLQIFLLSKIQCVMEIVCYTNRIFAENVSQRISECKSYSCLNGKCISFDKVRLCSYKISCNKLKSFTAFKAVLLEID